MTIKRTINGKPVEITLTEYEMWEAYREQEHEFDKEDVVSMWEDMNEDEELPEMTEEQIETVADCVRKWLDANDNISEIRWDNIRDAIMEELE